LLAHLVASDYPRCEPPVLQPAAVFLDLSGEDIRGKLYLTSDSAGSDYCLRPEYTIPVCRAYLASPQAGQIAGYSYLGPVFRFRQDAPGEFIQAGLESFGRPDAEAADAEILSLALEAATAAGAGPLAVRIGDAGLFSRLIDVLDLPPVWARRIKAGHAQSQSLASVLNVPADGGFTDHSGVLAALEGADKKGARALVEDLLSIAGISAVGGRSTAEIAERFLEQAAAKASLSLADEKRAVLEKFLAIGGDPDSASAALRKLADEAKLDLAPELDAFDQRLGFIATRGIDVGSLTFGTGLGRNLDYYTGFVFEAHEKGAADPRPLIGGGRYDRLLATLGAASDIPAVGAAIRLERLQGEAK
jgi:ATP phosphoribosyltransferase regulatory subunit